MIKKYNKLSADCEKSLFDEVMEACKIEKRSIANFVRIACCERAKSILEAVQDDGKQ